MPAFLALIGVLLGVLAVQADRPPTSIALEVGRRIERELTGGQTHSYQITLNRGDFYKIRCTNSRSRTGAPPRTRGGSFTHSTTLAVFTGGPKSRIESMPNEIFREAVDLPQNDRATLAGLLIDSLEGPPDPDLDAAWAEIEAGTVTTIPFLREVSDARLARLRLDEMCARDAT